MSMSIFQPSGIGTILAEEVEVEELSAATYDDVQDYINFFGDRTLLSGGGITDNSNGTATVASGTAWAKATDSDTAVGKFFDFSADNSVNLTDLVTNYLYLDYNGGTPQIVVSTSIATHIFKQDHIHIATIFRNGTTLHFHEEDAIGIGRVNIVDSRLLEMHDADRATGLVTTDGGSLALSITAGVIYEGLNRHTTSVDGSTWSTWYYDGDLGTPAWVEVTSQSTIDNANYNDVATGLANLTANKYAVHWVYVDIDGANLFIIYGQGDYTINQAEEAGVPASLPDIAVHYGVLIAKVVVQQGQTSLEILYPWTTTFHSSLATDHGSLAGLADDDHTQYLKDIVEDTTPQLGGALDMNEKSIDLTETLDADGKYSGFTRQGVYGATIAYKELIFLNTADQRWEKAQADAEATSGDVMLGIALESGNDGDSKLVFLWGFLREDDYNFTSYGQALFIDAGTAGVMTQTKPSTSTNIVRVVGYADDDADTIFFCPSPVWLEIA